LKSVVAIHSSANLQGFYPTMIDQTVVPNTIKNTTKEDIKTIYNNKYPRKPNHANLNSVVFHGTHDGAQGDPLKWEMPGWRIEQTFSKNTLIGNWCEERGGFEHNSRKINSTNRIDYKDNGETPPECQTRRHALRRNDGSTDKYQSNSLGGGNTTSNISWYDTDYRRASTKQHRKWDRHRLVWQPEFSDHPVQGNATQLGIRERKFNSWREDRKLLNGSQPFKPPTTYTGDFKQTNSSDFPLRYSIAPKNLSAQMNTIIKTNKSLPLRGKPLLVASEYEPKNF
jgi:hypothetical protein